MDLNALKNLDLRFVTITAELNTLRDHLDRVEKTIEQTIDIRDAEFEQYLSDAQLTEQDEEWNCINQNHQREEQIGITRMFRGPYLVSLYSVFEFSTIEIASHIQKKKGIDLALNDLSGSSYEKAKKYYAKVLKFKLFSEPKQTQDLALLINLRNIFAHSNGRIDRLSKDKQEKLYKILNQKIGATQDLGFLCVEADLVAKLYGSVRETLIDLIERFKEWDKAGAPNN